MTGRQAKKKVKKGKKPGRRKKKEEMGKRKKGRKRVIGAKWTDPQKKERK